MAADADVDIQPITRADFVPAKVFRSRSMNTRTGDRGLYPAGFIAHLRLYRHIRQAAIREFFLFAVGSHAVIIYFGWLGLALYNIVVRIMVRVDVRVRVTQG